MHPAGEARKKVPMWKKCREQADPLVDNSGNDSNSLSLRVPPGFNSGPLNEQGYEGTQTQPLK